MKSLAERSAVNLWRCAPARILPPIVGPLGYALYIYFSDEFVPNIAHVLGIFGRAR